MYYSSLRSEEGKPITFHVVYLNPDNPDPHPPRRLVKDRWSCTRLGDRLTLSIQNLIKIALASDPRSSSLAVYHDNNGDLFIWGLVDQGNRYYDFVNYESESGPERPGIFQASILGIGHVAAFIEYVKVAELNVDRLVGEGLNVFREGPVRGALDSGISQFQKRVRAAVTPQVYGSRKHWDSSLSEFWISALCRLLIRTQNYRHGGAFLITPKSRPSHLKVKFQLRYPRLRTALETYAEATIRRTMAIDAIFDGLGMDATTIPADLHLSESISENLREEASSEIDGTIWFISLLTRVDGLVLLTPSLEVRGFGVEITAAGEPQSVLQAEDAQGKVKQRSDGHYYARFGTRHRSMMRYCSIVPGSIGFVVSQDGDIRVMTVVKNRLLVWENLLVQFLNFWVAPDKGNAAKAK